MRTVKSEGVMDRGEERREMVACNVIIGKENVLFAGPFFSQYSIFND